MATASLPTYYEVLTAAIADVTIHGYDSEERIAYWAEELRRAAERSMKSPEEVERMVRDALTATFAQAVDRGGAVKINPGVAAYTIDRVKPELRAELDRRIAASLNLIKINRPEAIAKAQQRFRGWATSIPAGGSRVVARDPTKQNIRKSLKQLPFEERRVIIDQNAKLVNAINSTVALAGGAVGAFWHSHKDQVGYDGRPEHNARDGKFFLVKNSWAQEAGFVKVGPNGYTTDIDQPSEKVFCRCSFRWIYSMRSVPQECITEKGKESLAEARRKLALA